LVCVCVFDINKIEKITLNSSYMFTFLTSKVGMKKKRAEKMRRLRIPKQFRITQGVCVIRRVVLFH